MRVVLADDVADRAAPDFLCFRPGRQAELAHRVDDAALHGFRPSPTDGSARSRITYIEWSRYAFSREVAQRLLLDALEFSSWSFTVRPRPPGCPSLEPFAAVGGALLGEQHVHQRSVSSRIDRQLHEPARARSIVVSRSCSGFISPRPFEAGHLRASRAMLLGRERSRMVAPGSSSAYISACRRRCGTAAASRRTRGRCDTSGRKCRRNSAQSSVAMCCRRSRRPRGCRSCGSAGARCRGPGRRRARR